MIFRSSLRALMDDLYQREIQSFMLECGPDLAFAALESGIIDKIVAFVAPRILGGRETPVIGGDGFERLTDTLKLDEMTATPIGPDLMITAYVHRNY
jgi:diaminohydroxyphosphoribosylaminopyrimidine deaminase/5-amino-6-(5-phosphoribosylamino)uracil reductase